MKSSFVIGAVASLMWHSSALPDATPPSTGQDPSDVLAKLQAMSMQALEDTERVSGRQVPSTCSLGTAQTRQDWEHMSVPMRASYVQAVQCLFDSPSKLTQYGWPTKSRYDDFVAVHVNMTTTIHNTGNFLGWHRYFVHAYETILRDECGYTGYAPYWNWFAHRDDVTKSPVFDGSPTSLGSDGEFFYHPGTPGGVLQIPLPSGRGGGCIKEGPFAGQQGFPTVKDLFVPKPHCIRRDLNSYVTANYFTTEALLNVTLGAASESIKLFQEELQGGFYPGHLGMHAAGHFVLGGDGTDVFSSPNDPAFFLHHAMVDRVWWMWQALHPTLATTIDSTITMNNDPPSRNATIDDRLETMGLAPAVALKDVFSTLGGGPLCYIYV
ncbi:Di-copper centre-containing protein [Apiospora marii]|uniref:Di-copper centre-containing protein n=1 Tax=Apiospora marii TaxID=335849 RepID=A0ABR1SVX2_9PEZI